VIAAAVGAEHLDFGGQSSPDGAITLLLSDIEDAHDLAAALGERRAAELFRDHGSTVRQVVRAHGGDVVKEQADGLMASFPSAHAGLRCAAEMQRAFSGHFVPEVGRELRLRIGLHSGFLIADANAFFGRNVVLAARIADRARGSEILVSSALRQYTATDPSFRFEHRGEVRFRGLVGEHDVYELCWREDGAD
jgi:class 3 adenylate cyclase